MGAGNGAGGTTGGVGTGGVGVTTGAGLTTGGGLTDTGRSFVFWMARFLGFVISLGGVLGGGGVIFTTGLGLISVTGFEKVRFRTTGTSSTGLGFNPNKPQTRMTCASTANNAANSDRRGGGEMTWVLKMGITLQSSHTRVDLAIIVLCNRNKKW
jgi:hypothetical protein